MAIINLIYTINSIICASIGLPANLFLFFLILRYTEKEMQIYSRLLLQTCVADLLYLVIHESLQPNYFVSDGVDLIAMLGPIKIFGNPTGNILYAMWNFLFYFSVNGLAAQFVYRYLMLCRQFRSPNLLYFLLLTFVILLNLGFFAWMEVIFYTQQHPEYITNPMVLSILNDDEQQNTTQNWTVIAFTNNKLLSNQIWLFFYFSLASLSFIVMFICAHKIKGFIRRNLHGPSNKSKLKIQQQISKTLFFQAIIPGCILCSIIFGAPLGFFADSNSRTVLFVEMLLPLPLNWLPVLNPLVAVWTIKAYR